MSESITVTANNRLARRLHAAANAEAERSGAKAWHRATILPWGAWLRRLYDELLLAGHERRALLSPSAELLLWEDVVAAQLTNADALLLVDALPLVDVRGAARSIQAAWRLLQNYRVSLGRLDAFDTAEARLLQGSCAEMARRCQQEGLIDEGRLASRLCDAFARGEISAPARVVFYAFDELSPAQRALWATLEQRGAVVERRSAPRIEQPNRARLLFRDHELEIRAAVRWACARLVSDPQQRIAIVVPRLQDDRSLLQKELEEALEPGSMSPGHRPQRTLFNISLGEPLSDAPLAHDALLWLRLLAGDALRFEELLLLLRSPFCDGAQQEADERTLLGVELRRHARPTLELAPLLRVSQFVGERLARPPQRWLGLLRRCADRAGELRDLREPAASWRSRLRELLKAVGWPGERVLDSDEHQQFKRLGEELDALAALDLVRPQAFDLAEVVHFLERTFALALFQPETKREPPLQILGQLEAAGQRFDRIWLLGLDETHWPTPVEPNPFLPLALQRELRMPHASSRLALEQAQRLTEELLESAREVLVSTPRRDGETECMPSPLIADLPLISFETFELDLVRRITLDCVTGDLEHIADGRAPKLDLPIQLRGGSAVFADQAACPFRAFAKRRLRAEPLETPVAGLDPIGAGRLVHRALELIWGSLADHATLVATSERERAALVSDAVERAIAAERKRREDVFSPRFTALLRARLERLFDDWLEIEAERAPFRVVTREERVRLEVGGIGCTVQVDRIDELADKTQIIIDYKTGKSASSSGWLLPRIQEPQLPLYTLAASAPISGVALAKVRRDKHAGFEGLWRDESLFPARHSTLRDKRRGDDEALSFDERLRRWSAQLEGLAAELAAGEARVTPGDTACSTCGLDALCRHRELYGLLTDDGRENQR